MEYAMSSVPGGILMTVRGGHVSVIARRNDSKHIHVKVTMSTTPSDFCMYESKFESGPGLERQYDVIAGAFFKALRHVWAFSGEEFKPETEAKIVNDVRAWSRSRICEIIREMP